MATFGGGDWMGTCLMGNATPTCCCRTSSLHNKHRSGGEINEAAIQQISMNKLTEVSLYKSKLMHFDENSFWNGNCACQIAKCHTRKKKWPETKVSSLSMQMTHSITLRFREQDPNSLMWLLVNMNNSMVFWNRSLHHDWFDFEWNLFTFTNMTSMRNARGRPSTQKKKKIHQEATTRKPQCVRCVTWITIQQFGLNIIYYYCLM